MTESTARQQPQDLATLRMQAGLYFAAYKLLIGEKGERLDPDLYQSVLDRTASFAATSDRRIVAMEAHARETGIYLRLDSKANRAFIKAFAMMSKTLGEILPFKASAASTCAAFALSQKNLADHMASRPKGENAPGTDRLAIK